MGKASEIEFFNLREDEQVYSPSLIISGKCLGENEVCSIEVKHLQLPTLIFPVNAQGFKCTVLLTPGKNVFTFVTDTDVTQKITCYFTPLLQDQPIHLCLMLAKDSPLQYDSPESQKIKEGGNSLDLAIKKLRVGGRLMQAYTNEQMRRNGFGNRTFPFVEEYARDTLFESKQEMRSTIKIHILHSDRTVQEIRDYDVAQQNRAAKNSGGLYDFAMEALNKYGGPFTESKIPVQAAVVIMDAHWDGNLITGHAALGGGNEFIKLAIFGSHGLYSWPTSMEQVVPYFSDSTKVSIAEVANDNGECGTHWECLTITLGAFMHEIGHLLGCPHQEYGVMLRDYITLNRSFLTKESYSVRTNGNGALPPIESKEECRWHRLDLLRFLYHPSFTLPEDFEDPTFYRPSKIGEFTIPQPSVYPLGDGKCRIKSELGVYSIEIFCGDLSRGYFEYLPKSLGGPGAPREIVLSLDEIRAKLPEKQLEKYKNSFSIKILPVNGPQVDIDNFPGFINFDPIPMVEYGFPEGVTGIKSQLFGSTQGGSDVGIVPVDIKAVKHIRVYHGAALDGIKFTLKDSNIIKESEVLFGVEGRSYTDIGLKPDEVVTGFHIRSGQWVDAIQIITNKGKKTEMLGNKTGGGLGELEPPADQQILGLYGRVGQWIVAIGIVYGKL